MNVKLTAKQAEALEQAAGVNQAELSEFRAVTVEKLNALGYLTGTRGEHVITRPGLRWLLAHRPDAVIADVHRPIQIGDRIRNVFTGTEHTATAVNGNDVDHDGGLGGDFTAFEVVETLEDPEYLKVCQHGRHSDHCTESPCTPNLTATQKLARLQAEVPRHECGLSRQGIDCMCADAAELGVDTEELDDVEETEPVTYRMWDRSTVFGRGMTVLGSSALGIFYQYDGSSQVRTMLASQLRLEGDRYQALCVHDCTQHDSCPNCDAEAETAVPRPLTLAEYMTKVGTSATIDRR